jgi:DNA invertase Pin-like site-specific DNA recombinase
VATKDEAQAKISGPKSVRCAIYTRKSTEEGLAHPFNSLDAQRESGEAYIWSQRHMGWIALERRYDDGGYSGANLERPGLRGLMEDIASGQVDCVVVYKVDRLSRSLLDFARLIGIFEEHGVSLVSVTQQLNTTDSLGRLTLNILLSFAQFERELIAERTRDKMRAARRKGRWLGGQPILGYDVDPERGGLQINAAEARRVHSIFQWVAEGKSAQEVLGLLGTRGWTTKHWISRSGRQHPGRRLEESDLARLVENVMYMGKLRDGEQLYQADHAGLVDGDLWERANAAVRRWRSLVRVERRHRSESSTVARAAQITGPPASPRLSRLLALALKMEQMIQEGTAKSYSELAHLGQVSAARLSQVMNLLHLAPDIQEEILLGNTPKDWLRESAVRKLSGVVLWSEQRDRWHELMATASVQKHPESRPLMSVSGSYSGRGSGGRRQRWRHGE